MLVVFTCPVFCFKNAEGLVSKYKWMFLDRILGTNTKVLLMLFIEAHNYERNKISEDTINDTQGSMW